MLPYDNGRKADGDAECGCRPGINPDSTGTDYSERNKISGGGVAHLMTVIVFWTSLFIAFS